MKKINDFLKKILKWNVQESFLAIFGCFLYAFAVNLFIVPNNLYTGGILGIAQLIRSIITELFGLKLSFDISGIISFMINVPLFIMSYKLISKTFFRRTLICVIATTIFLTVIPIPAKTIIDDILTSIIIAGILAGIGGGMTLSASGSGGGTDIIGLIAGMRNKRLSVGKISLIINMIIYIICGCLYGLPPMIYSIIYVMLMGVVIDQTHKQNICSYVMIFTKTHPKKIIKFISEELERDVTYWEAQGAYNNTKTYISYSAMSKYEMERLKRHINELSPDAFMIKSEGIGIEGNFKKNLTN